jgi:hypothetical protein
MDATVRVIKILGQLPQFFLPSFYGCGYDASPGVQSAVVVMHSRPVAYRQSPAMTGIPSKLKQLPSARSLA